MKNLKSILALFTLTSALAVGVFAHSTGDHGERKAGPNGGRVLTSVTPHAEFWVMPDKKIQITFLNEKGEPVAPSGQVVTVTTGQRSSPVTLTFEQKDNALVSTKPLAADKQPAIVQIKSSANTKPMIERFTVDLSICSECKSPEYACTCH